MAYKLIVLGINFFMILATIIVQLFVFNAHVDV